MGLFGKGAVQNGFNGALPNNSSYSSSVVNGQLVPVYTMRGMFPSQAAAPYYYGNGAKPATLAGYSTGGSAVSSVNMTTGIGGGPSGDDAGAAPWNLQVSPTGWAIAFLVIGFLGLRHIHWRAE